MDKKLRVIGLSGTNGSGKDTVGQMLADHHNYFFISVTDLLRNEAKRRGLPVERQNLREISAEWRRELGLGVLVEKAVAEYEKVSDKHVGVVLASLRNPGEADSVHEFGGTVIWLDADSKVRYDRIQNRTDNVRAEEDNKTFEQFIEEEEAEMHSSGDSATLNMAGVKEKSDLTLDSTTEDKEQFRRHVEAELNL